MKRKIAALAALVMLTLPLAGCWNYREVETLSIVAGLAIDQGMNGHKYHLTIDIANTSGAGKDKPVETKLIESDGDSIFDAVRTASKRAGTILYWQNCQIVIVSREIAEEGLQPIIDYIGRDAEFRITMEAFVSAEETAKAVLASKPTLMSIKSFEIDRIYEQNESRKPVAKYLMMYETGNIVAAEGQELALPCLKNVENADGVVTEISGMALFHGDKLAGTLSQEDSRFAMFVMNHVHGGTFVVHASTGNEIATLEIYKNKTSVRPVVENGAIRFTVQTETDVALDELDEREDVISQKQVDAFTTAAETQLKEEIVRVMGIVQQETGLDIFGFGEMLHRSNRDAWYRVRENWDEVFRTLPVDVSCKINIRNSAERRKPVKVND